MLRHSQGFTLVEIFITLGLAGIFCLALYGFYQLHLGVLKVEETKLGLRESSRLAIDFIVRELRMAGARPVRGSLCEGFERLTEAESQRVTIQYDFRGNSSATTAADGCPDDPSELITYLYDGTTHVLKRATSGGSPQPFINEVPNDGFLLQYFNHQGEEFTPPLTTQERADVYNIKITIATSSASPDPIQLEPLESHFSTTVVLTNPPH